MRKMMAATLLALICSVSAFGGDIPMPGGGATCTPDMECPPPDPATTGEAETDTEESLLDAIYALIFGE